MKIAYIHKQNVKCKMQYSRSSSTLFIHFLFYLFLFLRIFDGCCLIWCMCWWWWWCSGTIFSLAFNASSMTFPFGWNCLVSVLERRFISMFYFGYSRVCFHFVSSSGAHWALVFIWLLVFVTALAAAALYRILW